MRCYRQFPSSVCVGVCAMEENGRLKSEIAALFLLFYELGLYVGFL